MARPKWEKDKVFTGQQPAVNSPAPLPSNPRGQGADPDAVPYIPSSALNDVYETGAAGFPTTSFVSPEEKRIEELEEQLANIMQQVEGQTSGLAVRDGTLLVHGFQLTSKGLIAPDQMNYDAWRLLGDLLFRLEGSIQWLIGDWLAYGEDVKWGDIPELSLELGKADQTLHDYASVARRVQFSFRQENLSYTHHAVAANSKLTPEGLKYALEAAVHFGFSVSQFRKWIKLGLPETGLPSEDDLPSPTDRAGEALDAFAVEKKLNRFFKKDPSTPKQKEEARQYIRMMRQHLDVLEKKCR
jgi:hypothetical protein